MGSVLKLTIDRQNRKLVSYNGTVSQIPDLFQSNTVTLQVQVVDPAPTTLQNPTLVNMNGFGLRASVGPKPTGASGGPALLALQDTFTYDNINLWWIGDLTLNTVAVNNYIGAADFATAWFELNLTIAGNRDTLLQQQFVIRANVDEGIALIPDPAEVFLTKAETLALLAAKLDKVMKSPSGTWARELGIADDGTPTDSIGPA